MGSQAQLPESSRAHGAETPTSAHHPRSLPSFFQLSKGFEGWEKVTSVSSPTSHGPRHHAPLQVPQSRLAAGQAVEEPIPLRVVAVPPAEAHPGRQLQLDVVRLLGPRPQELEAALRVEEDGIGVLIIVGYDCLEGVELPKGQQDRQTSWRGTMPAED